MVCVCACVSVFGVFVCTGCCVWQWLMVVCWWLQWRGDTIKLFSFTLSHAQSLTHILSPGPRSAPVGPPHPLMPPGNGAPGRRVDPLSARTPHQSLTRCISLYLPLSCPCTPSFVSLPFFSFHFLFHWYFLSHFVLSILTVLLWLQPVKTVIQNQICTAHSG